ncbi:MAG: exodeoxyribonuclease III [Patescibacteria group bacterium]|nr:exodeoxyribonuclease III [Patescibacteria group bacterium]
MKIISWNTNGLRATVKQGHFDPLFSKYKPDVVCFQETKAEPDQLTEETRNKKGYYSHFSYSKVKKGYSGVAIYSKIKPEKVEHGIGIRKFDDEGRIIIVHYKKFILINCYFPNGGRGLERLKYKLEFYDAFLKYINKLKKKVIFCGDVNTAHEEIDLARPKGNVGNTGFLPVERAWMDELVNSGWIDVFRYFYPNKKNVYTYWDQKTRARDRNVGWRIDYFFSSPDLIKKVNRFSIYSNYLGSDHCPILIDISI